MSASPVSWTIELPPPPPPPPPPSSAGEAPAPAPALKRGEPADAVWQRAPVLFALVGSGHRLRAANPAWQDLLGLDPARLDGRRLSELVHPDDLAAVLDEVMAPTAREVVARMCLGSDGGWRAIAWLVAGDAGERVLVGRPQAAADAAAAVDRAALQQAQRLQAITRLCGGMSHEFNNLLQSLRHALELIRRQPADAARVCALAETGLRAVGRGSRLTLQLMDFSGRQRGSQRPLRLADLTGLCELLQRQLGPTIGVSFEGLHDAGWVLAEPERLQSALLSLAINAGEAMPAGGRLLLRCERVNVERDAELASGAYLKFSVSDEGPGMTAALRERAFEPFFTNKPIGAGAGLGLSQVWGFAHHGGGSVRIEPAWPRGTRISLLLPAIDAPEAAPQLVGKNGPSV